MRAGIPTAWQTDRLETGRRPVPGVPPDDRRRFHWRSAGTRPKRKVDLASFHFDVGTLLLTEASSQKRAGLFVVKGEAGLADHQPPGLEVLECTAEDFATRLKSENHTLKRSLTDPRMFSGIGNAYSDEILHAARLSPLQWSSRLNDEEVRRLFDAVRRRLRYGPSVCGKRRVSPFPKKSPPFAAAWQCTDGLESLARTADRPFNGSCMRSGKPTIARPARPAAEYWPTVLFRGCSRKSGRARWIEATSLESLRIQRDVFDRSTLVGVGDVHLAITRLDDRGIREFASRPFQSQHGPPRLPVGRQCHVQHVASGRKAAAASGVVVDQEVPPVRSVTASVPALGLGKSVPFTSLQVRPPSVELLWAITPCRLRQRTCNLPSACERMLGWIAANFLPS